MQQTALTRFFDLKFVTSVFIVVGTSIGAGMLGLPVQTAKAGFFPSISLFILTWFITIVTGILFSEVILSKPPKSNYMSLGRSILGAKFTGLIFGLYLLLFYSLIAAYTKGIGIILSDHLSITSTVWNGSLVFILLFMPLMYFGTNIIGQANSFLTLILLTSFFMLISAGNQNVSFNLLKHHDWSQNLFSLPFIIGSFGFHGTLPSLVDYLDRDKEKIQWAIVTGSTITLLIYICWELFVLGIVPLHGEVSLSAAWNHDQTAISPLSQISGNPMIWNLAHVFSLTAIITSFLGVSMGLIDFFVDAFQLRRNFITKTGLLLCLYLSALFLSMTNIRIFYLSLNYGAGLSAIFLLIFLPTFMIYKLKTQDNDILFFFSKKTVLPLIFIFSAVSVLSCLLSFF